MVSTDKNKPNSGTYATTHMHEALTPERLDGSNYVEWSLYAQNKIKGKKRWGYITGTKVAPKGKKSEEYEAWEDEDCLVKSWLLDSMTKRLWQEYDAINDSTMEHFKDVTKYNKMVNSQRVYVFLAGLDSHLDGVRGRILATTPLPNVQSVYATVCA
ncbi:Gag-polypeptide of LTR copia-type [Sesbania bispinosa]|nr:Gag-polypeptide of LTR copia-type [Sesbania bispinosa]